MDAAFGDHGGLILAVNDTDVIYSWNEGKSWDQFSLIPYFKDSNGSLSRKHFHISRVESAPAKIILRFLLCTDSIDANSQNIILINLEGYHEPLC